MNNSMEVYQVKWSLEKYLASQNNLLRKNKIRKSHDFLNHGLRLISFEYPTLLIFVLLEQSNKSIVKEVNIGFLLT